MARISVPVSVPTFRSLSLLAATVLFALGPAQAQTGSPATSPSSPGSIALPSGARASGNATQGDPALSLRGMPCSVSLNSTGGVTTSPSCTTDPLAVPTQTLVSPAAVNGTAPVSAQSSGGGAQISVGGSTTSTQSSSTRSSSATAAGGGSSASTQSTNAAGGGGGAPSVSTTLCASGIPSITGATNVGSLVGTGC